jgi:hypothetical protein
MLTMSFLHTLMFEPVGYLVITDDHRICALGDFNAVAHMVTVSVADEDKVRFDGFRRDGSGWISREEGIDDNFVSVCLESKRGMPIPGQFRSHKNLLFHQV